MIQFADMVRDEATLDRLWEAISKFPQWTLFDGLDTKEVLAQRLADTTAPHWDILEGGKFVGYCTIYPDTLWSAVFHILFFDKRVRGRIEQVRRLAEWYLKQSGKVLLRTMLPVHHRTSIAQALRMGFQADGIYRAMATQKGQLVDFVLMSFDGTHSYNGTHDKQPVTIAPALDEQGEAMLHFLNGGAR